MDLLVAWGAAPAVLAALCTGCGLAISAGLRTTAIPLALVPGVGFAVLVVTGQFTAYLDVTAELTAPILTALALVGLWLARARLRVVGSWVWPVGAAGLTFAVYAAPIVASGEPTFAGYIKLDDTATWLAFTDHIMEHGRDLGGLAPSSHEATLALNVGEGYPIGVFIPLGVVAALLGEDPAWLIQPYMAFGAVLLALALFALARRAFVGSRGAALVAALAAQPALLYGYYLWGGIKEIAAAALVATLAALLTWAAHRESRGSVAVVALVAGALVGVLSPGGLAWALPVLLTGFFLAVRSLGRIIALRHAAWFAAVLGACSVPVLAAGAIPPPTSSPLTDDGAQGNLAGPLDPLQLTGIWPSGDFRFEPADLAATHLLIALVICLALAGSYGAYRRRLYGPLAYSAGAAATAGALAIAGSPWVDGKLLATASPAVLFAAALGALALSRHSRLAGAGALMAVLGGVVWSNALAYLDVNLAPRDQLKELERIGELTAGEGPALMTEYQPYGVRHFLREADPEGASELRRRRVSLKSGRTLPKGEWADTDAFTDAALAPYRTLVLRRSPEQSRPPGEYEHVWRGRFYDVWQRPADRPPQRRSLIPSYGGDSATFGAIGAVFVDPEELEARDGWGRAVGATVAVPRGATYRLWLGGSARTRLRTLVNGLEIGETEPLLNNRGLYVDLGPTYLDRGSHRVEIHFEGSSLRPGSDGLPQPVGPIALTRESP